MVTMIVTDYKSIASSVKICIEASKSFDTRLNYIIVDNSCSNDGLRYLEDNDVSYEKQVIEGINVYVVNALLEGQILFVESKENGGYAKGNNLGVKISKSFFKSSVYIFSNNDLFFPQRVRISEACKLIEDNPKIGIIGPNVLFWGKERQNPRNFGNIWTQEILWNFNVQWFHCIFNKFLWNLVKNPVEGEVDWVTGCFMIIRAKAFDMIGGFDENTFLYAEEMIISTRMKKMGYMTYYLPQMTIVHNHNDSRSASTRKLIHRSKMYYYKTYTRSNSIELLLAELSFRITEWGYYIYHDRVKAWITRNQ